MSIARAFFPIAQTALKALDAETAHGLTIKALKCLPTGTTPDSSPLLRQSLFGLDFPNPLGLAAGFDKNAEVPDQMLRLGFGFVEVGTLTPRAQAGNPRPRLFRLKQDQAVINRMGFNNDGHVTALSRLVSRPRKGIVGVNIGANKDSADRASDYVAGLKAFAHVASYFTINISSPNTPGLRGLQSADALQRLLAQLNNARQSLDRRIPMFLKIAPDLGDDELVDVARCCADGAVDAVIISNTTVSRPALFSQHASEAGGLSGAPLCALATRTLARFFLVSDGRIPLIGVGGISNSETAFERIRAGASLLQLYTALVYRGPALVDEILERLPRLLAAAGYASLAAARGANAQELATTPIPADKH
jgi:dihydroorotate dehydrogenase